MTDSSISGFHKKDATERINIIRKMANLTEEEVIALDGGVNVTDADHMVENAIGTFALPLGIATNFRINGRDYLIPMAIEEPSVIAAASFGAKTAKVLGGFEAKAERPICIGQIQVIDPLKDAEKKILERAPDIIKLANTASSTLSKAGRGAQKISCKTINTTPKKMLIVELEIDVYDAMGANIVNSMCERAAPLISEITGGRVLLRILSNYSEVRIARATALFEKDTVGGGDIINDIILAYEFACSDIYRAVTHNKGIMNGIIAVSNAMGQDGRAIDAAAHAYAAKDGYGPLTEWSEDEDGNLKGTIELPLQVGTVGGITNSHKTAKVCSKILGASSSGELACVMAAAGLAQNFSALRALAGEGIQRGHMRLHARNVATAAGAPSERIDEVASKMAQSGHISYNEARRILDV